ncbi:hypothetical protein D8S78_21495 [Natrialba swarupiae]|nr:hypothetical protein [Natrialba swarupiae]
MNTNKSRAHRTATDDRSRRPHGSSVETALEEPSRRCETTSRATDVETPLAVAKLITFALSLAVAYPTYHGYEWNVSGLRFADKVTA